MSIPSGATAPRSRQRLAPQGQAPAPQQPQPQAQQPPLQQTTQQGAPPPRQGGGIQPRGAPPRGAAPQHGGPQRQQVQPVAGRTGDWLMTGQSAAQRAEQERERKAAEAADRESGGIKPFRFFLDWRKRESAETIILDAMCGPRIYEHDIRNPRTGFNDINEQCVAEMGEICPCCPPAGERPATFRMFLSIIDLRSYTSREGNYVPASRKLLPVGTDQQGIYERWLERYGTLRGIRALHIRDGGQRSSRIGNNIEFIESHSEEDLQQFAVDNNLWAAQVSSRGNKLWDEGGFIQPFDYTLVFPRPDADRLRRMYGGGDQAAPMGSQTYNQNASGGGQQWGNNAPGQRPQRGGGFSQGYQQGGDHQQGAGVDDEVPF